MAKKARRMILVVGRFSYKQRSAGFSLVELLIVILVISILYSMAGSLLAPSFFDPLQQEVEQLHHSVKLAQDESAIRSQALALGFDEKGYQFFSLPDLNKTNDWQALDDDAMLGAYQYRGMFKPTLYLDGAAVSLPKSGKAKPQIFILPTGEMKPFKWELQKDKQRVMQLEYNAVGQLVGEQTS
jgi:general secretion pathway protein H